MSALSLIGCCFAGVSLHANQSSTQSRICEGSLPSCASGMVAGKASWGLLESTLEVTMYGLVRCVLNESCTVWCAVAGVIGMSLVLAGGNSVIWLKHTSTFIYITGEAFATYTSAALSTQMQCLTSNVMDQPMNFRYILQACILCMLRYHCHVHQQLPYVQ